METLKWPTIISWIGYGISLISFLLLEIVGLGDFGAFFFVSIIGGIIISVFFLVMGLAFIRSPYIDIWRGRAKVTLIALLPGCAFAAFMVYAMFHSPVH